MQNDQFRIALDVTELFNQAAELKGQAGAVMSMGGVIGRKDFAQANPEKVAAFMEAYAASVEFVNSDVEAASKMVEEQGIMPKAAVAAKAIPNCHIVFITRAEMKAQLEPFFQVLFDANPASVGGALPDPALYYMAE